MFFYCFAAFLLLAPLYKAGNRPLPLLLLELVALGLLFTIVAVHRAPLVLPRALTAAIGLLLVYPLVQLFPLPEAVWRALPGHGEYAAVLDRFANAESVGALRAISVIPTATEYGWLALLLPLACFLGVLRLSRAHTARLLLLLAVLAGAEAVLGLLQVGPSGGGMLYFGNEEPGQYVAIGTYVNRNHLAALLAMSLPVIVGLIVYGMRPRAVSPPSECDCAAVGSRGQADATVLFGRDHPGLSAVHSFARRDCHRSGRTRVRGGRARTRGRCPCSWVAPAPGELRRVRTHRDRDRYCARYRHRSHIAGG